MSLDREKLTSLKESFWKEEAKPIVEKKCRWCGNEFDPKTSEHKELCSDTCFHEEKAIQ